jgi:hypothetical protein
MPVFTLDNRGDNSENPDMPLLHTDIYAYRKPADKPAGTGTHGQIEEQVEEKATGNDERFLLCSQCRQIITRPAERIEVTGAHQHTFANPHGIVYEIGCFRTAMGCGHTGPTTDEFTWFPGFKWRIAICTRCLTHMGWLFIAGGGEQFHGLILDRLIESD